MIGDKRIAFGVALVFHLTILSLFFLKRGSQEEPPTFPLQAYLAYSKGICSPVIARPKAEAIQVEKPFSRLFRRAQTRALLAMTDGKKEEGPTSSLVDTHDTHSSEATQNTNANESLEQHFLDLLQQKIDAQAAYPWQAEKLHQKGVVTVSFLLSPEGRVDNLEVYQSSHIPILDEAAISAVQTIEPLKEAPQYLQKSQVFHIDIRFE